MTLPVGSGRIRSRRGLQCERGVDRRTGPAHGGRRVPGRVQVKTLQELCVLQSCGETLIYIRDVDILATVVFLFKFFFCLALLKRLPLYGTFTITAAQTVEKKKKKQVPKCNSVLFPVPPFSGNKLGTNIEICPGCKIVVNYKKKKKRKEKQGQTMTSPTLTLRHNPFASFIEQEKGSRAAA